MHSSYFPLGNKKASYDTEVLTMTRMCESALKDPKLDGCKRILILTDCLSLIQKLRSKKAITSREADLFKAVGRLTERFQIRIQHVK